MAIQTISGREILFKIAEDTDNLKSAYVSTSGTTTSVTCPSVTVDANTYQYAIGRILGKGNCIITAHTSAGVFTVATLDSAPAANELFQWCWWTGNKGGDAIASMNEAIRYSWPFWYRERQTGVDLTGTVAIAGSTSLTGTSTLFLSELSVGDMVTVSGSPSETREIATITSNTAATVTSAFVATGSGRTITLASNITLATGTYRYALPTACDALLAIGIQPTGMPVEWLEWGDESAPYWRVEGQRGAYFLRFNPHFNFEGTIADAYNTSTLVLWYATREPQLTTLTTASCQLPLDYFAVASTAYAIRNLQNASRIDLITANVAVPQLQEQARVALQSLGVGKRPPNRILNPDVQMPEYKLINQYQVEGDDARRWKRFPRTEPQ